MMDAEVDKLIEEELSKLEHSENDMENYAEEDPLSDDDSDIEVSLFAVSFLFVDILTAAGCFVVGLVNVVNNLL